VETNDTFIVGINDNFKKLKTNNSSKWEPAILPWKKRISKFRLFHKFVTFEDSSSLLFNSSEWKSFDFKVKKWFDNGCDSLFFQTGLVNLLNKS
jgi:hypothetical protein